MTLTFMLYVNILIGAAGTTVYLLWAGKWWQRRAYGLFSVNLVSAFIVAGFVYGYTSILLDPGSLAPARDGFRYLLPFLIGGPVVARILEYRQDQMREEFHRALAQKLMAKSKGEPNGPA